MNQQTLQNLKNLYESAPAPLFGFAEKSAEQMPNELKYWINGYLFYKRCDGKFFMIETDEKYKKLFAPNTCALEDDFDCSLDEANENYKEYIKAIEDVSEILVKYGVAPVSFDVKLVDEDKAEMADIVFITIDDNSFDKKYFVVDDLDVLYNFHHHTIEQINKAEFKVNTLANPHHIEIDDEGNMTII